MAATPVNPTPKIHEKDVRGLKYFDRLGPLLERLHDVGCQRDTADNRVLHYDQYCLLVLLFLFNPIVTSLRALQQASELANVQKKLGCARTSLGSLSESVTVFDPQRLKEIIAELGGQLEPLGRDPRLKDIRDTVKFIKEGQSAAAIEAARQEKEGTAPPAEEGAETPPPEGGGDQGGGATPPPPPPAPAPSPAPPKP